MYELDEIFDDIAARLDIDDKCVILEQERSSNACVSALSNVTRLSLADASDLGVDAHKPVCDEVRQCMQSMASQFDSWHEDSSYPEPAIRAYRACLAECTEPLGRYFGGDETSSSRIELYWLTIGITAEDNHWTVEDLAQVVLLHEWAHAFTHLGRDGDDCCLGPTFHTLERPELVEGLAQYWVHYASRCPGMAPAAFRVYAQFMRHQSQPYREHLLWLSSKDIEALQGIIGDVYSLLPPHSLSMTDQRQVLREGVRLLMRRTVREPSLRKVARFHEVIAGLISENDLEYV